MRLTKIFIENFRSIADLKIDFNQNRAIGLVGINESGKSNILKALALIQPEQKPSASDVRVQRASEPDITNASVAFDFELNDQEIELLAGRVKFLSTSILGEPPKFNGASGDKSFIEFARSRRTGQLYVDLMDQSVDVYTHQLSSEYKTTEPGWIYFKSNVEPISLEIPWLAQPTKKFNQGTLLKIDDLSPSPTIDGTVELDATQLDLIWQSRVAAHVKRNLPKCVFWSYDKENLLPAAVGLEAFCANPDTCKPLQSIFEIAGVTDIEKDIAREKGRGRHHLDNYLSRVSERATNHIKFVWKDYKAATIHLSLDGAEIRIAIKDENLSFEFGDRSDGFKRFVTFLLLISARVKTSSLSNLLLLIDEPEISLHPAGIRNLRDELLRISENNFVVYATHSPHMIDRRCIDRHIVVQKINDVTVCEKAGNGRIFDEEVLLNSLGVSIFESIKSNNLLFEGWRDKKLFEIFRDSHRKMDEYANLPNYGTAFLSGVKDAKNVVPILSMTGTKVNVISDHDNPALEAKKAFEEARFDSKWFTYRELEGNQSKAETAEDFIKPITLKNSLENLGKNHNLQLSISEDELLGWGRLRKIEEKIRPTAGDNLKSLVNDFKSLVFDSLKSSQIDERYAAVAASIAKSFT